jgi:hypothetical protein
MQELIRRPGVSIGTILATGVWLIFQASAQGGGDAEKLLKGMADYVASQKTLSVSYDSDIEVVTSHLQKIQFTSSGQVQMSRPDKLRATRTGGYRDVEIVFDGKMLTVSNKDSKDYAQIEATGTAEELIDVLREEHGIVAPGADLLLTNVFNVMMTDVVEATVIGKGVIDGVECDHLAFRNVETDWQIWIEAGTRPIPPDSAQIRDYQQGYRRGAAIHAANQGMEDRRTGGRLCLQAGPISQEDRARRTRRHRRSAAGHHQSRRKEMTRSMTNLFRLSIGTVLGAAVLLWNGQLPIDPQASLVSSAEARVGRPLTPMSYAGVARRTTRRAVAVGAVATGAAVVAAPVVVAPACAQVVDAYGRIATVCR